MFENPRRGRQARNFTTTVPKILHLKSSSEQIFSENWRWVPLMTIIVSGNKKLRIQKYPDIQLFRERLSEEMCTRQSRKVIWDKINTLFLTLYLSNLLLLLSFSSRKHMCMASRAILSTFFEEQQTQSHPQYLSGLLRALFPTTLLEIAVCGRSPWI